MDKILEQLNNISNIYQSADDVFSTELEKKTELVKQHISCVRNIILLINEATKEYTVKYQTLKTEYDSLVNSINPVGLPIYKKF